MNDMPVGLMMTLAENGQAMRRFAELSDQERSQVVARASQAVSRDEMRAILRDLP